MVNPVSVSPVKTYEDFTCGNCIFLDLRGDCINPDGYLVDGDIDPEDSICSKGMWYYSKELCTYTEIYDLLKKQ